MILQGFTEPVEDATLAWLESRGWFVRHGDDIAPDEPQAERTNGISRKFTRSTGAGALA